MSLRTIALVAATGLLAACDGAPSASDIKGVHQAESDQAREQAEAMAGGMMMDGMIDEMIPQVMDISDVKCEKVGENVYECQYLISGKMHGQEFEDEFAVSDFRKTDKGWFAD